MVRESFHGGPTDRARIPGAPVPSKEKWQPCLCLNFNGKRFNRRYLFYSVNQTFLRFFAAFQSVGGIEKTTEVSNAKY